MNKDEITLLYEYNYWANARVLQAATKVSREQFVAPARLSQGSLRGALAHTLGTEVVWRLRWQEGISVSALPTESDFPTLEALQARWADEERKMRGYLAALTDKALTATFERASRRDVTRCACREKKEAPRADPRLLSGGRGGSRR